jgi:hypothetical protein
VNTLLPSNGLQGSLAPGQLGIPIGKPPTKLPGDGTTNPKSMSVVPNKQGLWEGGALGAGTAPSAADADGQNSPAYQIRTGGINPTTVGLLWPAYQNLTETHVVEQASITAIDTQVTVSMGQIPTMATVAGTILDPIAALLGYTLTQAPPIGSPSLPIDTGGDITDSAAVGAGGAQVSNTSAVAPPGGTSMIGPPTNLGDNSWGSNGQGNPIQVGTQQAASPFFNYAGIPLQKLANGFPATTPGAAMTYPPVSAFPTAAAFVGQENILSDFRPYGPGYLFWPNPQNYNVTGSGDHAGAYEVKITQPSDADYETPPSPPVDNPAPPPKLPPTPPHQPPGLPRQPR